MQFKQKMCTMYCNSLHYLYSSLAKGQMQGHVCAMSLAQIFVSILGKSPAGSHKVRK